MRIGALALLLVGALTLSGCSGSSSDPSTSTSASGPGTTSGSASTTHGATTGTSTSHTTGGTTSSGTGTSSTATSSSTSGGAGGNATGGKPAPASGSCDVSVPNFSNAGTVTCSVAVASSTGGAFTAGTATLTYSNAVPCPPGSAVALSIADSSGTVLGSGSGASPITFPLTAVPATGSVSLVASVTHCVVANTGQGQSSFTATAKVDLT